MSLYKSVELKEGEMVQYLGVYVLKWRSEYMGEAEIGFVEADLSNDTLNLALQYLKQQLDQSEGLDNLYTPGYLDKLKTAIAELEALK